MAGSSYCPSRTATATKGSQGVAAATSPAPSGSSAPAEPRVHEHHDEDEPMPQAKGAEPPMMSYNEEELRDREKLQLRFAQNDYTTVVSDKGVKLTRCHWDQSSLLQSEWDVPIMGKNEGLPWQSVEGMDDKRWVILMDRAAFLAHACTSTSACGILNPMSLAKLRDREAH